jgi:hypothetical protein
MNLLDEIQRGSRQAIVNVYFKQADSEKTTQCQVIRNEVQVKKKRSPPIARDNPLE